MLKTRQGVWIYLEQKGFCSFCIIEIPLKANSGRSTKAIPSSTPMKEMQDFQKWGMNGEVPLQSLLLMARIKFLEMAIKWAENLYVIWEKLPRQMKNCT